MSTVLDLAKIGQVTASETPYRHLVVGDALRPDMRDSVARDFPAISQGGSYPDGWFGSGPTMKTLLSELTGPSLDRVLGPKLGLDLENSPKGITLRGVSREKDGSIHPDSPNRIATVLLYCNGKWEAAESAGSLRILNSASNMDDYTAEVAPLCGNMVAFKRSDTSFHGYPAFAGIRRLVQVSWFTDKAPATKMIRRAWRSALFKAGTGLLGLSRKAA